MKTKITIIQMFKVVCTVCNKTRYWDAREDFSTSTCNGCGSTGEKIIHWEMVDMTE